MIKRMEIALVTKPIISKLMVQMYGTSNNDNVVRCCTFGYFDYSSLPKKSHLEYIEDVSTSRSRSSDNLTKFPCSVSPLARRIANFESCHNEQSRCNIIHK